MRPRNGNALWGISIVISSCFCANANAVRPPRIELLREMNVTGARILLADLLPASAGNSLRVEARDISLGAAPQPGHARVLKRSGILEELRGSETIAARVAVPEQIVVSSEARPLGAEEIFAAILNALAQVSSSKAKNLAPEDLLFQTQILVRPGDAGLKVLRFDFDPGMRCGRFLLRASRDPGVLPFYVAAKVANHSAPIDFPDASVSSRLLDHSRLPVAPRQSARPEILVSPVEQATLVLRSGALNVIADVIPLERGSLGQRIRVRVADTGKIFSAQVDGRAHLELRF